MNLLLFRIIPFVLYDIREKKYVMEKIGMNYPLRSIAVNYLHMM